MTIPPITGKRAHKPIRMGVLIPEFPGQTHNFFWREIAQLEAQGASIMIFSTRRPPSALRSTSWNSAAVARTTYLGEFSGRALISAVYQLISAGPHGWWSLLAGIRNTETRAKWGTIRLFGLALAAARMAFLCKRSEVMHVHVHSCADAAQVALYAHLLVGQSYSLTLHGPLADYGPNQDAKWRSAAFQVVITQSLKQAVIAALPGLVADRLHVAPMGIDATNFKRSRLYQPYVAGQRLELFCCARLNRVKGHAVSLRVVARLRARGVDVHLTIAGEDDAGGLGYRLELHRMIADGGLTSVVTLLGAVSEEVVREELQRCHIFVLLSDAEPLGVAYMEAMAMEVPVLGTAAGGVPELIVDGLHGVLVTPGDESEAAAAITRIILNPEAAVAMGREARLRVIDKFSSEHSAQTLLAAYRQVTE